MECFSVRQPLNYFQGDFHGSKAHILKAQKVLMDSGRKVSVTDYLLQACREPVLYCLPLIYFSGSQNFCGACTAHLKISKVFAEFSEHELKTVFKLFIVMLAISGPACNILMRGHRNCWPIWRLGHFRLVFTTPVHITPARHFQKVVGHNFPTKPMSI